MRQALVNLARLRPGSLSIRDILILITAGLTLVIALLSARDLMSNVERLNRARALRDAIDVSDQLFAATESFSFERDLVLSMLQAADNDTVALLEPRLEESRAETDRSVQIVQSSLAQAPTGKLAELRARLAARYAAIRALRPRIDAAMGVDRRRRDPALVGVWSTASAHLMDDTEQLWVDFVRPFTTFDATATQHLRYRYTLRTITDYTGRERSIIGQILSENSDPTLDQTTALLRGQGVLDLSWTTAQLLAQQSGLYASVGPAFTDASSHYATLHDMMHEMFYVPGAHHGGFYPMGPDLWFELSSQASDSLAALRDVSRTTSRAYLDNLITTTERAIWVQVLIALLALALCAGSFWLIVTRAIRPINEIVDALTRATQGEIVDFTSAARSHDEIGKLAAVLEAFQGNVERIRQTAAELDASSQALENEVGVRREAEEKAQAQVERLALLHRISRAIGERQDLHDIFQVVIGTVEEQLPADFVCICLSDADRTALMVASVGAKSASLAQQLTMHEGGRVEIDSNGLSRCLQGRLVYEPDVSIVPFPFPARLASGGLRSLVAAPLQVESNIFGAMIVARKLPEAFSSGECEFLRQLSEHVALASHQAQLNAALQQAYDDLRQTQEAVMQQERLRALGQMASGIAHDINNALSPIALYTESLLATEPALTEAGRNKLEVVQRAIDDAAHTISRMSEFYRRRDAQLELTPVDVNTLVRQVLELTQARWRDMPQQRGDVFDMRTDFADDTLPILGVEAELREALTNLVFNAVDAMPHGGTIALRTQRDADPRSRAVHIEIVDSGVGMDEQTLRRCLEPFFTTKGDRGTGLGLAMVYGVVQRHGAAIDIKSEVGKGTIVRLTFTAAATAAEQGETQSSAPLPRLRLLIIDDDPILLRSLREVLENDGHIVVSASGGGEGIAAFADGRASGKAFDAVITDLGMPAVDGRRVAASIKSMQPSVPVILLTGWGERLRAEEETTPHVDRVLSKPPKMRDVREALASCLPSRTARTDARSR